MKFALAGFLLLHGLAHVVGFLGAWGLITPEPATDPVPGTSILGGRFDLGPAGMKAYGIVWLLESLLFAVVAMAILAEHPLWLPVTLLVVTLSLVTSILSWPEARIGVWVNLAVLVWIVAVARLGLV